MWMLNDVISFLLPMRTVLVPSLHSTPAPGWTWKSITDKALGGWILLFGNRCLAWLTMAFAIGCSLFPYKQTKHVSKVGIHVNQTYIC